MNCREIQEQIDIGLLSTGIEITDDIRMHLDTCDECRAYHAEMMALGKQFQALDNITMTPEESAQLLGNLEHVYDQTLYPSAVSPGLSSIIRGWLTPLVRPAIAAAFVLVIALTSGDGMFNDMVASTKIDNLQMATIPDEQIVNDLVSQNSSLISDAWDDETASYITQQVEPDQAADILDNLTAEEFEYLMDNYSMEI